jgi:hypothetical protein
VLAKEFCKVVVLIVEAAAEAAIQTPSTNEPFESFAVLTVTVVGSVRIVTASVTGV